MAPSKQTQFTFRNRKPRGTTIQADRKLGRYVDVGPIKIFQPGGANGNLSSELVQVL